MEKEALIQAMRRSISEVFETMFFLPVEVFDTGGAEGLRDSDQGQITATRLNFSGPFSGSFVLLIPEAFAIDLTADFLGRDKKSVSQDNIKETSKEIINMLAGNTFAVLDDRTVFNLQIPESVVLDEANRSSINKDGVQLKINTIDNIFILKMIIHKIER